VLRPAAPAALLLLVGGRPAAAQPPSAAAPLDGSEVRRLEETLAAALHARDRARLEALLADDYVLRAAPDIDRATWLRNAVTLCWGERSDIDRFETRRVGDAIVATFELTFYVSPYDCRPAVLRSLITDVWARAPQGWRLQVRHAGAPPPPGAGVAAQFGAVPLPPPIWEASSELSLVATGGNTSTRTVGAGGELVHRRAAATTRASAAFLTSEAGAVTRARSLTMKARYGVKAADRVELFGDGAYARDRFAGIDHRAAFTGGVSYAAPLAAPHALTADGGLGVTVERRLDGARLRFATATGALHYAWAVAPGTELTQELTLDADLQTRRNWRGASATAVSVTLTRLLSLKASHAVEYRHAPVAGFGRTDMRTAAALVLSLQRRPAGG
jgi:putative salt-induced outer membrane protein YdiY